MKLYDTIAAIATPVGSGGIAILRLSGNDAEKIAQRIITTKSNKPLIELESHKLTLSNIHKIDEPSVVIDEALVAVMRAPRSYTGEDVVEINCHGGYFAAGKILSELLLAGARMAEGGEFTRRAFLNGKTDLTAAEATADIIDAHSSLGMENAALSLNGALAKKINSLRERVIEITSHISAAADYPEEVDAPETSETENMISGIIKDVDELLSTFDTGRILREGVYTVIAGRPNVGKSSLLNALSGYERAIVTDIPGTTRDVIEEFISLGGVSLRLLDTAGIRNAKDEVERLGIDRAKEHLKDADLCLLVIDGTEDVSAEDINLAEEIKDKKKILIINKADKGLAVNKEDTARMLGFENKYVIETALPKGGTPEGISDLEKIISDMFVSGQVKQGQVCLSNARQRDSLIKAKESLVRAKEALLMDMPYDILYVDLEDSLSALGEVVGTTVQEEIIEQVFSRFCVGK